MKAGTTSKFQRPIRVILEIGSGWVDIDLVELLHQTGMAQSKGEAKRILLDQCLVWIDDFTSPGTIYDRLRKVTPSMIEERRRFLIEVGDVLCVGKNIDEAVCHRIIFKEKVN